MAVNQRPTNCEFTGRFWTVWRDRCSAVLDGLHSKELRVVLLLSHQKGGNTLTALHLTDQINKSYSASSKSQGRVLRSGAPAF